MVVSMLVSGCGNSNKDNNTEKNSEVVSGTENVVELETETETESQVATNDSEDINSEEGKNSSDDKNDSDKGNSDNKDDSDKGDSDKPSEEPAKPEEPSKPSEPEKPAHTCNFATLKTDANNHWYACSCGNTSGKGAHGYDDEYDASCNSCGYTRSVPERPVEPSPSEKESINFTGEKITLPTIGVSVPTLPHFNTVGTSPETDAWWTGSEGDGNAMSGMNSIYNTCESITATLRNQGLIGNSSSNFTVQRNSIVWNWLGAGSAGDFMLQRANGYYVLEINASLSDFKNGAGTQLAGSNRDIVTAMCSFISSTPKTLADYIYKGLYEDASILNTSVYKSVGDCQVKFDSYFYENENGTHCKFYIKSR